MARVFMVVFLSAKGLQEASACPLRRFIQSNAPAFHDRRHLLPQPLQFLDVAIERLELPEREGMNLPTRMVAAIPNGQYLGQLSKCEPKVERSLHEKNAFHGLGRILSIAVIGASSRRDNPARFSYSRIVDALTPVARATSEGLSNRDMSHSRPWSPFQGQGLFKATRRRCRRVTWGEVPR